MEKKKSNMAEIVKNLGFQVEDLYKENILLEVLFGLKVLLLSTVLLGVSFFANVESIAPPLTQLARGVLIFGSVKGFFLMLEPWLAPKITTIKSLRDFIKEFGGVND